METGPDRKHAEIDESMEDNPLKFGSRCGSLRGGNIFAPLPNLPTKDFVNYDNLMQRHPKGRRRAAR